PKRVENGRGFVRNDIEPARQYIPIHVEGQRGPFVNLYRGHWFNFRAEPPNQTESGRRAGYRESYEIGSGGDQCGHQLPHIARPERRFAARSGSASIHRDDVVNGNQRRRPGAALQVFKIAQRLAKRMVAIDEREAEMVDAITALVVGEEFVARLEV